MKCKKCGKEIIKKCKSCANRKRESWKSLSRRGWKHSEETKEKIRKAHLGRKLSDEHRRKIVECLTGRVASKESKLKMSLSHFKRQGSEYKKKNKYGYILCFEPTHPNKNSGSRVFEHRLVMEKKLGRYITKNEQVHHINKIKDDNRPENLYLVKNHKEHKNREVVGLTCPHCKLNINLNI